MPKVERPKEFDYWLSCDLVTQKMTNVYQVFNDWQTLKLMKVFCEFQALKNIYRVVYGSEGKEFVLSVGDWSSIPGLGRSPEEGNGNPLQYSCLQNSIDRGDW